jgi:two-component system, LytTR family, sensor histidine kinase AlgZ
VQAVLMAGALVAGGAPWWWSLGGIAFAGLAGTLLWLVTVCALRSPLRQLRARPRAAVALGLGAAAAVVGSLPLAALDLMTLPGPARLVGLMLAGAGLAGLMWAWLDQRARIWAPVDARVRLAELQSRIRPHFLFNALNTALALVRVDPSRAEQVLEDLSQIFRVALADAGASVSLEEELALARAYLGIEQVRFGERLTLHWEVDPAVGRARVPPLLLQPLVENAVRHGVEPLRTGAQVLVKAQVRRGHAVVEVSNSLGEESGQPGHGMALHNMRERLRLLHDVAAQLETWRAEGRYHARITIPLP